MMGNVITPPGASTASLGRMITRPSIAPTTTAISHISPFLFFSPGFAFLVSVFWSFFLLFRNMAIFPRGRQPPSSPTATSQSSATVAAPPDLTKAQIRRATRTRKIFALLTSFFLFITVVFVILVEVGGTYNRRVIRNWYFLRLDLSHIIPNSVPNYRLINTIAQTIGLHDFYQVGLWGFCEGYLGSGVSGCSKPETLYWFNPVEILRNQLLAGASSKCFPFQKAFFFQFVSISESLYSLKHSAQ